MQEKNEKFRPPVVVVMGHVDHGKSKLLDYIRKSNVVEGEAGGITQHISAYEVIVKDENKKDRLITFLDTPGHEAFSKMRTRGAQVADIAILVVSAEDGVKAQTIEAHETIIKSKTPFIVAINKIDRPNANIEKTKIDLSEKGIYLEGMGGDIPFVLISAKTGEGIKDLLDMIILISEMQGLYGNTKINASGVIIESKCDPKRGVSATCIIKNGTLKTGMFVVSGYATVKTKIFENFLGKPIKEATFSSPVRLVGFDNIPEVGSIFESFNTKKEAEEYIKIIESNKNDKYKDENIISTGKIIPITIKTDVSGTIEAIEKEILKLNSDEISFKIVNKGVGSINESDLKMASINKESLVLGFNVKIDNSAKDLNDSLNVQIEIFDIIYKLIDRLKEIKEERRPLVKHLEVIGSLKVIKTFGSTKSKHIVGGKVISGKILLGSEVKVRRRDFEIGFGKITELQSNKIRSKEVNEGSDCGLQIETKVDISAGDLIESFEVINK